MMQLTSALPNPQPNPRRRLSRRVLAPWMGLLFVVPFTSWGCGSDGEGGGNGGSGGSVAAGTGGDAGVGGSGAGGSGGAGGLGNTAGAAGVGAGGSAGSGATGGSGGAGAGGSGGGVLVPGPIDELLEALPPNSWLELSDTWMRDVCPQPLATNRCDNVQAAWSGGAYDSRRDRMVVFGGGHGDSFYNQLFVFDLGQLKWERLTEMPEGATPSTPTEAMRYVPIEPCGYYPKALMTVPEEQMNDRGTYIRYEECDAPNIAAQLDFQQPRSSHTYSKCLYDPGEDRFCYFGGGYYPSAQASGPRVPCFSFSTGLWSRVADTPRPSRGGSAIDANGHYWVVPNETGRLMEYDPATDSWATHTSYVHTGGYLTGDVDRARHQLLMLHNSGVLRFDLNAPEERGVILEVTGDAAPLKGSDGFVYADVLDRFVAWGGGAEVYFFDPAARVWTRRTGGGATVPEAPLNNGTYGRFRYSPLRGVFVLVNGAGRNVFVYKP
ncbi:MAG: hypothetical protein KIT72_16650 [Polyangiaceae bacterium]|nr:hypothetical protein [Polyangiaceae bacterium]MCW5792048.1 hypothetical protein [Polyangiaceae bacterium]